MQQKDNAMIRNGRVMGDRKVVCVYMCVCVCVETEREKERGGEFEMDR